MANIWQGRLVRLRAVEPRDWEARFAWNQDSEISRQLDYVWPPSSEARVRRWAEETSAKVGESDDFAFEIEALAGRARRPYLGPPLRPACRRLLLWRGDPTGMAAARLCI